jgi:hypothetical protein
VVITEKKGLLSIPLTPADKATENVVLAQLATLMAFRDNIDETITLYESKYDNNNFERSQNEKCHKKNANK